MAENNSVKQKKTKTKARKVRRVILITAGLLLLGALIWTAPAAAKVWRLNREAAALVKASTAGTFQDTKTTLVYDAAGDVLCELRNAKDLYYIHFEEIPKTLANAFVVMEDRSFYTHAGIDYKGIFRAALANRKSDEIVQGASTITQQLARNIFLTQEVTWERKIEEMFIARGLEKKYSKNQILEFYLNNIYFGNGYYGVEAAARGYLGKSVSELSVSEQAFLAAIPNNPTRYHPITNYENTLNRRNLILGELYEADYINSMEYYTAKEETIILSEQEAPARNNSVVTYVRHCATESLMSAAGFSFCSHFSSSAELEAYDELYGAYYTRCQQQLLSGGYTVYTSFDTTLQETLQTAVDSQLAAFTGCSQEGVYEMQGAATCIDNETGDVVAIVGGRSQDLSGDTLNRAYQSYRQPGSSIKPLSVYLPFLQLGNDPDTIVSDVPVDGGPSNADGVFSGEMTLREAVARSKNTVAWQIYQLISPRAGAGFLLQMGFHKIWCDLDLNAGALGGFTYGVSTEEMAGAYAALENEGTYRRPTCIRTIADAFGTVVVDEANRGVRIYETNACRMMTDMLKTAVESGTGTGAATGNAVIAGKTGTTNSNKDAWFCGYSKYYTTAVWVGYDYPKAMDLNRATDIFRQFMTAAHESLPPQDFTPFSVKRLPEPERTAAPDETETETQTQETQTPPAKPQATAPVTAPPPGGTVQPTTDPYQFGDIDAQTATDPDATIDGGDW